MRFFTIFSLINAFCFLFVGINFRILFSGVLQGRAVPYWIGLFVFSQLYWISRYFTRVFEFSMPGGLYYFVSILFGIFIITFITLIAADILFLALRIFTPLSKYYGALKNNLIGTGFAVLVVVFLQSFFGIILAESVKVTNYKIEKKDINSGGKLRIVQLSDLHITDFTSVSKMNALVDKVNSLNPDIIAITGDIIDSSLKPYIEKELPKVFRNFKSVYGTYAVLGNHEYYGGEAAEIVKAFEDSGFIVLCDKALDLDGAEVTIAGRDDYVSAAFKGRGRKRLANFIKPKGERTYPVVLLNHQPRTMNESIASGIAVELTGHTHNAQLFPLNFILKFMYPISKGILQKRDYTLIVHSGTGYWGFPFRTNSRAEIVVLDIN